MIHIVAPSRYKVYRKQIAAYAQSVQSAHGIDPRAIINIVFVGKRKMMELARTYKQENVALPVLSFAYLDSFDVSEEPVFGEIIMCYPQVVLLAAEREKTIERVIEDLTDHAFQNLMKDYRDKRD